MEQPNLTYDEKGNVAWLTMNRPHVLNALSKGMFRELALGLKKASKNRNIRFIVITGAGNSFSAGLDIKQVGGFASKAEARNFVYSLVRPFWQELFACEKPVLSMVDGPAYGAGAEMALASDIVIASTRSKFAFSGGRVGALCCISGIIGPQLMRGRRVVEMNLSGNAISADQALEVGLATYVVPEDQLTATVERVLSDLQTVSPISTSSFKRITSAMIPKTALGTAYRELFRTITSPDFRKGSAAFAAKQAPVY
jgi:enoyl-CoA hydratase / 3-hydroxyacyl-CoA dehydrogenase